MPSSLITRVAADIRQLEADLAKAEARWRKYEEIARKAATVSLTGGSLGSGGGGGGGAASAAAAQRRDIVAAEKKAVSDLIAQERERKELRLRWEKSISDATKQRAREQQELAADEIARVRQLEFVRLRTEKSALAAERETSRERIADRAKEVQAEVRAAREGAAARRSEATALRGQIRQVVGTGGGAGPPFRPLPTGSRPEDIIALRQHLAEADAVGARL